MEKKKSCNLKTKSKGFLLLACILLVLLRFKINRVSATGFTHIQYNGNFFFESNSSGAVSGGNGTEENPYIIENLVFSMANESESPVAINISNTDVHFIIRYCAIYDLRENTSVHGILFNNVTNGKIQDVDFNQWNYENRYRAAWCGIVLENSTNCTISGTRVGWIDHGWPYQENRFTLGILLKNTNYSTIIGNTISATLGIILQSSNYNNISSNLVTNKNSTEYELKYGAGVYPTTYPEIVLVGVRLDNDCHYNLINDNQIYPYWDHAIYLRDETNRYNTIINNYNLSRDSRYNMVTGAKGGPHVEINSMAQPNYLFKIKKPENKTYTGPVTPAPGYYASSERFETLENGISLTMLQNGWWRYVTGSCGIISNKTDASGYDHAKVVHFSSTGGLFKYLPEASEGTLEFWINKDIIGTGNVTWKLQSYKWLEPAQVLFTMGADLAAANELSFSDGAGWHSGIPFQDDKWYRFSIDFSMSGGYKGLGSKQYQFRIFDSDGVRILHESIVANFTDDGYVDDELITVVTGNIFT
ncbi:MAG: right-handed parallel beta-helix repeat-containing protein, partial [Candidatus Hodarchaeota archaeon]